jgi:hypothetical protein
MQFTAIERLQQRWEDYRPTKTHTFWIAAGCVAATLVLGFGPFGWVSGGTAQKGISEASANARQELATAVCVEEFMRAKDANATLAKIMEAGWYERGELVAKGGWATMPDRKEPNSIVATMCAAQLAERKPPAT